MMGIWIRRFFGVLFLLLLVISSKAVFDAFELLTGKDERVAAQKRTREPEVLLPTGSVNMVLDVAKPVVAQVPTRDDLDMPAQPLEDTATPPAQ